MDNNIEREFAWDDEIQNDSSNFVLLPDGDYSFKVTGFKRARFAGSEKMPPCPMAVLDIQVSGDAGRSTIIHNLLLHTKLEWKLCEFFTGIGQRKKGERLKMNWNTVIGSSGKCRVITHTYTKRDGTEGRSNQIDKFYEPEAASNASTNAPASGFKPGTF